MIDQNQARRFLFFVITFWGNCRGYKEINGEKQKQDHSIFKRVFQAANHPLLPFIPRVKACCYNLRTRSSVRPSIKSERFKSTFVNRLIFRYNLALE